MAGGGIKVNNITISGGADGATFTPYVDENGVLSWVNNKGYENPAPINLKGVGVSSITAGAPYQEDGYTVTPIVVYKTDGSSNEFLVRAKNGINSSGGVSETELLKCTYGITTFTQVDEAIKAGKIPYCIKENILYLYSYTSTSHRFIAVVGSTLRGLAISPTHNWIESQPSTIEVKDNKSTAISASSTDDQYPSAKAVYTYVNAVLGGALAEIDELVGG